jgi:hypothetical protein
MRAIEKEETQQQEEGNDDDDTEVEFDPNAEPGRADARPFAFGGGRGLAAMPSQAVDAMWHAFILDTRGGADGGGGCGGD